MKNRTIILNSDDLPSVKAITDTVSRLRKDYSLLSKLRGSKDVEEPSSFKSVISFLEMLVKREKKNLPKDKAFIDNHLEVMIDIVAAHMSEMDDWELKRTIEETKFKQLFGDKDVE